MLAQRSQPTGSFKNLPVPCDNCIEDPISRLLTVGSTPVSHSVLNVKALVGAFNQEKALVGAFSVIVKTGCGTDGSICGTTKNGKYIIWKQWADLHKLSPNTFF